MKGRKVLGYIRVSDESQVDGHSLDAQRAEIQRWCERNDYELVGVYADEGVSAYTDKLSKRPEFARLLTDAERGIGDVVVVHTLDRWARNSALQAESLRRLGEAHVGFASISENIDFTTPAGKMILTTLGAAQEFFSAQTGVHVRKSHRQKASTGLPVGPVPFGYRKGSEGIPVKEPREAAAVCTCFQKALARESRGSIAAWLNSEGFRTRKESRFTAHAVKDMLGCRFYLGVVRCRDDEFAAKHEALIDSETFDQLQILKRHNGARRLNLPAGVLQGRVGCIRCGRPLHSDRQHRQGAPMYRERHAGDCDTNNHACMADGVDAQVGEIISALTIPAGWAERIAHLASRGASKSVDATKLSAKRERIKESYYEGEISKTEKVARLQEVDQQVREAQPVNCVRARDVIALLGDLSSTWRVATNDERTRLVAPLIERAFIDVETRRLAGIVPAPGFDWLLREVLDQQGRSACMLLPAEAANQPNWWTWWRRGRVELPVQAIGALSLLQAYPDG